MAIAEMQKVNMALHKSISDELIEKIQKLGCCQFIAQSHERVDERDVAPLRARLRKLEELLGEARFVTRFLDPYATDKGGGMAAAFGGLPEYTLRELSERASEKAFLEEAEKIRNLEKRLSDARAGLSRINGLKAQLEPLAALPYPIDLYAKGTERVAGSLYAVPVSTANDLKAAVERALGQMVEIYALPAGEKDTSQILSFVYAREASPAFADALSKFQVSRIDVPAQASDSASDEIARLNGELATYKSAEESVTAEINAIANKVYKDCQICIDYWNIQKAKLDSLIDGEQTEQILLLSFWIPNACLERFRTLIAPYLDLVEVVVQKPEEEEQAPTLLKNPKWADAMEALTNMYGTPTYGKLDPTTIMTPFFYLFFGMCFGDAGYGLVISSLLIAILLKKNVTGTLRKFMVILIVGNLVALVYGALTFSWFGDAVASFSFLKPLAPLAKLQILDPMNDPMTLLGIALALGFFQIMFGLVIAMVENLKNGDKVAAFADQGGWIVFLCGLVLVGLSAAGAIPIPTKVSGIAAGTGALILVATQGRAKDSLFGKLFSGVLSLYNVTGYLGDVLSYSRLLALGLGSAAVGMVINLLANLVSGTPVIGIPLAALIFVLGHLFSIAVNMLGAFVHALRLQYVEFFGKFYEASGEEFKPLSMATQYVKLSEGIDKA